MGKKWDYDVPSVEIWKECLRVLKPGWYLLSFAGTRTQHRMAVNIEDAGFEIRDMIAWVYGSGFPKSLNIGKAIDKMEGTEYPKNTVVSENVSMSGGNYTRNTIDIQSELGKQWEGWGTALKPSLEPITVARKPLSEKTVAQNVLKYGTGGINIDGCRVNTEDKMSYSSSQKEGVTKFGTGTTEQSPLGRFPANLIHDGSDEVVGLFPDTKSGKMGANNTRHTDGSPNGIYGKFDVNHPLGETYGDSGSASRFFYCAKASKSDRNEGCLDVITTENGIERKGNIHSTVKPTKLMSYLVKLVTPKGGMVLDPFMGSGSTGKACVLEGFDFIGIDLDPEYCKIAEARIKAVEKSIDL
jgi:site-specific DNA-methyltransferase (adenine-specific)